METRIQNPQIPQIAQSQLNAAKRIQDQSNGMVRISGPAISAIIGFMESMESIFSGVLNLYFLVKPIMEQLAEVTNAMTVSINEQFKLNSLTYEDLEAFKKQLETIVNNQDLVSEVMDAAHSMYENLEEEEKQRFVEIDKNTEEEIRELETMIGLNVATDKIPISYLAIVFILISLIFSSAEPVEAKGIENKKTVESNSPLKLTDLATNLSSTAIYDVLKVGLTTVVCYIRNKASKNSKKVSKLEVNQIIHIIDEQRYYYKTTYYNEKEEVEEGYVAKRNVKVIEIIKEKQD